MSIPSPKVFLVLAICLMLFSSAGICQQLTLSAPKWGDDIGGSDSSAVIGQKIDSQNNIYVTGFFRGTVDFDPSPGVKSLSSTNGSIDTYVAKYDTNGNLIWVVSIGGGSTDKPNGIDIDSNGNIAITGQYKSATMDADPGAGVFNLVNSGGFDMFLINLDNNGNFLWAKSIGGSSDDYGNKIAIDKSGNRILAGQFQSALTVGSSTYSITGTFNGLVVKYDASGNLLWSINLGQTGDNSVHNVLVDGSDNIIIAGAVSGTVNLNPLGSANNLTVAGNASYIAKYTSAGQLTWVQPINGNVVNNSIAMSIDQGGNIYLTGPFTATLAFNASATLSSFGAQDNFLARYNSAGVLQFAKDIARGNTAKSKTTATSIVAGSDGNVYLTGYFSGSANFDPAGSINLGDHGQQDLFVAKYTSGGDNWWANNTGNGNGCGNVAGLGIGMDNNGDILLTGSFCSTVNFDFINCTAYNLTAQNSESDGFIVKYVPGSSTAENNIISGPVITNVCAGTLPGTITGTIPFGGAGPPVYQWQSSTDNVNFSDIAGAVAQNYVLPVAANTLYYRRSAKSGNCYLPVLSNVVTIAVQPSLANNTISAPPVTLFCASGDPTVLIGSSPTGGDAVNYTYRWQSSPDSLTFNDITRANSANYDPPVITGTTYYRRLVTSGFCAVPLNSNIIGIQIQPPLANNTVATPTITFFCAIGSPGVLTGSTPTGGDGKYSYEWQSSVDNTAFTPISGAGTKDYNPGTINTTMYFRRIITSGSCVAPLVSNVITIQVQPATTNNITAPVLTDFCLKGDPAIIVGDVPTGGTGTYTYQWQSSLDSLTFTDIAGVTTKDYDPPLLNNITYYKRVVTSGNCIVTSNVVTIIIQTPIVNNLITAPLSSGACLISGNVPTGGTGHFTYQWQSSANNITFNDVTGATNRDYSPPPTNVTMYYRRIASSGTCFPSSTSNVIMIQAFFPISNNAITNPVLTTFCVSGTPGTILGSNPSGGNGSYAYQWQSSADSLNFTDIIGATSKNYVPVTITDTTYYRRVVTSGVCLTPVISNIIGIHIQHQIANNTVTPPIVIAFCVTGNPGVITGSTPTGGDGTYTYQWQVSSDGISFNNIGGATLINYQPTAINATTYYRRLILSSGKCLVPLNSNIISLQIQPALANNVITAPAVTNFCTVFDPDVITGNTPVGGDGTYTYQWESSTDNLAFVPIAGATTKDYDPPVITTTTYYRRMAISGACSVFLSSNVITITQDPTVIADAGVNQTICVGGSATLNATGGTGYQWTAASSLSGAGTANPVVSPLVTTSYTVTVFKGTCSATASVTVNVIQKPTVNAGPDQTIVKGQAIQLNGTSSGQSNLQYHWSPAAYLDNPDIINPVANPPSDITYTLHVTTPNNCFVVNDDVTIKVYSNISVPNTFTPNSDGINDTWEIPALSLYPNCIVNVYNRYGALVFNSIGYPKGWNGQYNGRVLPTGTYYYTIDIRDGSKIMSGWVAIVR
ncbi:MAG: T9SS type B sorting domain-containing protein [Mucilaginibacter sp.]